MGKSSDARRDPRGSAQRLPTARKDIRSLGTARTLTLLTAGVLAVNVLAAGGMYAIGAWPGQFSPASASEVGSGTTTINATEPPAAEVVGATLAAPVPGYSATADSAVGAGQLVAYPCVLTLPTQPVVGRHRTFSSGGRTVEVTVSALPTGSGPWTLASMSGQFNTCADQHQDVAALLAPKDLGVAAAAVEVPTGHAIAFRRGDVLVRVFGQPSDAVAVSRSVDATLSRNLGTCASQTGTIGDERRNPWLAGVDYLGLQVDTDVTIPAKGNPAAPAGTAAVSLDATPEPIPVVELPERPADPVWPDTVPRAVAAPTPPVSPGPEPVSDRIKVPQPDPIGPGCGWAFTGAATPTVDKAALSNRAQALQAAARTSLLQRQAAWTPAVVNYYRQWAAYRKSVASYTAYATQVSAVATAWQNIRNQREDYDNALAAYQQAIADRSDFLTRQQEALTAYRAAVAECALPLPTPSPSPSGSAAGTPSLPAATPTGREGCPAVRPSILDESPPTVPERPVPPPDPRPVDKRN